MSGIRWRRKLWLLCLSILVACSASENAEKLIALAEQAKQEERLNVAADLYHRAAGLKPDDFNVQYGTGLLYLQVTNLSEAEEHLRRAIELRPAFAPARLNLGVVLLQAGDREAGRKAFLEALRIEPRFPSKPRQSIVYLRGE
jgi:tetratricopeptide (TPR) repeat protein